MPDAQPQRREQQQRDGIRDTLESVVVALILAFVFRAFLVEAFVIPTGSMAATLYGAHGTIICEDCGVEFAYGVQDLADHRQMPRVNSSSRAICPNCNHPNANLSITDDNRNAEKGDRILVLKWPLDLGGEWLGPARWDVVVFKDPADGITNFIKRLVGLPDEVLMLVDGDVFTVPTARLSPEAVAALERLMHEKYERREGIRSGSLPPVPPYATIELEEKLRITRKTATAQRALWTTVYDHDFPPRTLDENQPRWVRGGTASGWDPSGRRLRFTGKGVDGDYIELIGKEIVADCAYNIYGGRPAPVSDLRVRFVFTPHTSDATLWVNLQKHGRSFWSLLRSDGYVALAESRHMPGPNDVPMAWTRLPAFALDHAVEVSFENVDYRLAIRIGGEEVLASSDDPAAPNFYAPDLRKLRRLHPTTPVPPRIYAAGGSLEVSHLVVERDIYYYHDTATRPWSIPWAPRGGWGSAESPIMLRENEYFMLGDNTTASKDSRLWDQTGPHLEARGNRFQLGTVPGDQLIGKAFFVYWPSGHRMAWLPPIGDWTWRVIPDVGRMRWIR